MSADVKGDAYEGLLAKNAEDTKSGAGQYFTPRSLIDGLVDCVQPKPGELVCDPACGTGGFLLSAYRYLTAPGRYNLDRDEKLHLKYEALRGVELVDNVSRLCAMNLFLHGIGPTDDETEPPIRTDDVLRNEPSEHFDVVLTNPPFGKKSSLTVVNASGDESKQSQTYSRPDFWTTTSNKQLNFARHVKSLLKSTAGPPSWSPTTCSSRAAPGRRCAAVSSTARAGAGDRGRSAVGVGADRKRAGGSGGAGAVKGWGGSTPVRNRHIADRWSPAS
jgi:type I restriction enzyme M protein